MDMEPLIIEKAYIKARDTATPYWFQAIRMQRLLKDIFDEYYERLSNGAFEELKERIIRHGELDLPGIEYVKGDATEPIGHHDERKIIVHCCNNIGAWGAGFVIPLGQKYPAAREQYLSWAKNRVTVLDIPFELGQIQMVWVEHHTWVCNLIGQHGVGKSKGIPPIRYEAIEQGMNRLVEWLGGKPASVHMPRMGCGLAGGDWVTMAGIIHYSLVEAGYTVVVYDV